MKRVNSQKIEKAVREILVAVGENPHREGLRDTPKRVARFYEEALSGNFCRPEDVLNIYYMQEMHDEIVLLKNIPFYSICEHHLLPFHGKVHIAYLPRKKRLLGISKLTRLVEVFSKRLQLQERITKYIADSLMKIAKPLGVMVVIEAEHLCISMRGVKKPGTTVVTSAVRGTFLKDAKTRSEALSLIKG
ncbi:MAG: GTP cyclohydrolase I FolE [Elusimicrobiota bacterium]